MGRLHYKCMSCDNTIIEGQYCHECDFTPQQLAALAEKMGFALVPLEPTKEMEKAAIDRDECLTYGFHGSIYGGIYAAMLDVGRVKPQKPD